MYNKLGIHPSQYIVVWSVSCHHCLSNTTCHIAGSFTTPKFYWESGCLHIHLKPDVFFVVQEKIDPLQITPKLHNAYTTQCVQEAGKGPSGTGCWTGLSVIKKIFNKSYWGGRSVFLAVNSFYLQSQLLHQGHRLSVFFTVNQKWKKRHLKDVVSVWIMIMINHDRLHKDKV